MAVPTGHEGRGGEREREMEKQEEDELDGMSVSALHSRTSQTDCGATLPTRYLFLDNFIFTVTVSGQVQG